MHILVVEDDVKTASFIKRSLEAEGYLVSVLSSGDEAVAAILIEGFEAVVLDIMIHGRDGLSVVRKLRAQGISTPVLLCSARGDASERIEGLNMGADDYLAKPFVVEELIARVRALLRRGGERQNSVLRLGDLILDTTARTAQRGGRAIALTTREFRLLEYLMRSSPRICSRMMILEKVWNYHFDPGSNIVDVYIRKLRAKVDADATVKLLHSVRGTGYVMKEDS